MNNILKLCAVAALTTTLLSCGTQQEETLMQRAEKLQRSMLTIDTHTDTPMKLWHKETDLTEDQKWSFVDFPKLKRGALDVTAFAVYTGQRGRDEAFYTMCWDKALKTFDMVDKVVAENSDIVGIATTPEQMYALKKEGKLIIFPTIENLTIIHNDLSRIPTLYDRGARIFGLCHSYNNDICDSSSDAKGPEFDGLSTLGEEVVKEVNRLGGVIDVSHASDSTFFDVVRLSKTPIIASHSSVRAVADHNRNFSDEMLMALKENGGTIQICILDKYVKNTPVNEAYTKRFSELKSEYWVKTDKRDSLSQLMEDLKQQNPEQIVTVKDYVDHIDYVVKKIGIDYVGIGTDFEGGGGVDGCKNAGELVAITAELIDRGYSEEDIAKIWGQNFLRVFNKCIEYSKSLATK